MKLFSEKSLFLILQILGLLVKTLAADEKYLLLQRDNLTMPVQMQLTQKLKTFWQFLAAFLKSVLIFKYLKKKVTLTAFVFPKLRTRKRWLDKCLKSPVSEDPSTSNIVNVAKHCSNLHHITFTILIDHCQVI